MSYAFLKKRNNAGSTLNGSIISTSTSVNVVSAASFPASPPFICTIWNQASFPDPTTDPNMEIVAVTGVAGNVFTITRGQESTTAVSHSSGHAIQHLLTVGQLTEYETQINTKATIYRLSFNNASLSSGVLNVNHNLGQQIVHVQVFDNTNSYIVPDGIVLTDANNLAITLASYGTLTGTYNLIITG